MAADPPTKTTTSAPAELPRPFHALTLAARASESAMPAPVYVLVGGKRIPVVGAQWRFDDRARRTVLILEVRRD